MTTQNKTTWRMAKLGELVIPKGSVSGPFGSNIHSKFFTHEGVPVIRGNNLAIGFNPSRYVDNDYIFLSEKKADELSKSEALPEDIIVTARGTIGQTGIIPKKSRYKRYILSANQLRFRIDRKVADPLFVYYWLASKRMVKMMQNVSVNVGVPNLNLGNTRNLLVPTPSLPIQERVADVLSAFDDKIELNNKISAVLEQMAQAIFKEWFIKKSKFKNQTAKLGDLVKIISGHPFSSKLYVNDKKAFGIVTIKNVQDGNFITSCDSFIQKEGVSKNMNQECWLYDGDILLSLTGNVGRVCFVYGGKYLLNQRVAKLRPKNEKDRAFCYFLFRQTSMRNNLINMAKGSAQPNLSPVETGEIELAIPPREALDKFGELTSPIYERLIRNAVENQKSAALRDLLLPKLMSGEIRV